MRAPSAPSTVQNMVPGLNLQTTSKETHRTDPNVHEKIKQASIPQSTCSSFLPPTQGTLTIWAGNTPRANHPTLVNKKVLPYALALG